MVGPAKPRPALAQALAGPGKPGPRQCLAGCGRLSGRLLAGSGRLWHQALAAGSGRALAGSGKPASGGPVLFLGVTFLSGLRVL